MNIIETKQILGVKMISLPDILDCFFIVNDPVVLERFKLKNILDNLVDKDCSDEDKFNYERIISSIQQDMNNKKRDEPFPESLYYLTRIVLSIYAYKPKIAYKETIDGFEYTARKILSREKPVWLRKLPLKQRIEEIEQLLHFALVEEIIIPSNYDLHPEAERFCDLGADEGSIFSMLEILNGYISAFGVINIVPDDDETVASYAERLALDL